MCDKATFLCFIVPLSKTTQEHLHCTLYRYDPNVGPQHVMASGVLEHFKRMSLSSLCELGESQLGKYQNYFEIVLSWFEVKWNCKISETSKKHEASKLSKVFWRKVTQREPVWTCSRRGKRVGRLLGTSCYSRCAVCFQMSSAREGALSHLLDFPLVCTSIYAFKIGCVALGE